MPILPRVMSWKNNITVYECGCEVVPPDVTGAATITWCNAHARADWRKEEAEYQRGQPCPDCYVAPGFKHALACPRHPKHKERRRKS